MIRTSVPLDDVGTTVLAETARAAATQYGGGAEAAALIVRLLAQDARRRHTVVTPDHELHLAVDVDGTELTLTLRDQGEPVDAPPPAVLALVELGLATAARGGVDGGGNVLVARVPLPPHSRILDDAGLEVVPEDAPVSDEPVELRPLVADDAFALTRCIFRCYGWTYAVQDMYFPDRIAAAVESGRRIGAVAATPDGEIVAHIGLSFVADGVVESGGAVTDPRFRGRNLMVQLFAINRERADALGVRSVMSRPVLTHGVTQKLALGRGAHVMGMFLDAAGPVQQVGFTDGVIDHRMSYGVTHQPVAPLTPAALWIPSRYQEFVRHVLAATDYPLTVGEPRAGEAVPTGSVIESAYDAHKELGTIRVHTVGTDLLADLDRILDQFRAAGAAAVQVWLPADQPALATVGAGLPTLRLAFAALLPEFGDLGNCLVLQWLRNPAVDVGAFQFGDEQYAVLTGLIVDQAVELGGQETSQRLRQARREQLLALLPDGT